jgi:hypothetical protein
MQRFCGAAKADKIKQFSMRQDSRAAGAEWMTRAVADFLCALRFVERISQVLSNKKPPHA